MPSKRPSLLEENPPSVSSSGSSSEGEEDDSHGEEELTPIKSSSTIPNSNSIQTPNSVTQSIALSNGGNDDGEDDSTDDDESGSESDDSTQNNPISPTSPALDIKPISSKPMTEPPKPKKPDNSVGKRSLETDGDEKDSRKAKKKKKVSDLVEEDHETEKKSGGGGDHSKKFQKLWTEQDEIDILKGMVDFKKTKGDPTAQVGAFYDFLKNDLRSDVSKIQLQSKIRTLKRKYTNTLKRAKQPGEDPEISKPHEAYVYKLSKKVWLGEVGKDDEGDTKSVGVTVPSVDEKSKQKSKKVKVSDGLASSKNVKVSDRLASCEATVTDLPTNSAPVVMKTEDVGIACENPYLKQSFMVGNNSMLPVVPPALGQFFYNRRSDLIESSNASELDKKWKNVMIAETEAYIDRLELVKEQTKMMLDKLKSSNC
ncbi:Storekeeper protein [Thalictrum thalictroides]|uniref:Storekeeper protein n=1 Tax=Thalictrum thalictroides TaxID=46969 RepID=A0A7J6VUG1_THATH|nr:Storekeeper protein [Thalictrum thalictroides]